MKTLTSIVAAGAILAFAAQAGTAANVKHVAKSVHSSIRVGYGPYAYLGNTARVSASEAGPYAFMGNTAPVGP
ncbi:MAG TPA: hypothetical protein VFA42_08825 [Gaiellaceae bacterium]|nr:hypothetical protein [Gaiellaceae bacterium]